MNHYLNVTMPAVAGFQEQKLPGQSEVEREFARLSNAQERLSQQIGALWSRLHTVTTPQPPAETSKGAVEQVVNSVLGKQLHAQALNAEQMEDSINALMNALCI